MWKDNSDDKYRDRRGRDNYRDRRDYDEDRRHSRHDDRDRYGNPQTKLLNTYNQLTYHSLTKIFLDSRREDERQGRIKRSRFSNRPQEGDSRDEGDDRRRKRSKWGNAEDTNSQKDKGGNLEDRIKNTNPALSFNTPIGSARVDSSQIRRKLYLPQDGVNYIGLLIGPKGMFQKKLEGESGCKILIRGKGSQKEGQPPQPDENDDQHVLIMGDTEDQVERAVEACNKIIMADEETRNMIRKEQLKVAAELNNTIYTTDNKASVDESMLTPYGPPSPYAYLVPVPNECIGLIIGKKGETIKRLQAESGAKIQVAKKEVEETGQRYVFVEGPEDRYNEAKKLIDEVVDEWRRIHQRQEAPPANNQMGDPSQYPMSNNLMQMLNNDSSILDPNNANLNPNVYNNIYPPETNSHLAKDPTYQAAVSYQPYPGFRHPGGANQEPSNQNPPYEGYNQNPPYEGYSQNPNQGYPGQYPGYPPYEGYPGPHAGHPGPYPGQGGAQPSNPDPNQNLSNHPQSNPNEISNKHSREDERKENPKEGQPKTHPESARPESTEKREVPGSGTGNEGKSTEASQPPSDKHPLAHQYAEHYSKTLGGDYMYYYDYYMKTYLNPAQPAQPENN